MVRLIYLTGREIVVTSSSTGNRSGHHILLDEVTECFASQRGFGSIEATWECRAAPIGFKASLLSRALLWSISRHTGPRRRGLNHCVANRSRTRRARLELVPTWSGRGSARDERRSRALPLFRILNPGGRLRRLSCRIIWRGVVDGASRFRIVATACGSTRSCSPKAFSATSSPLSMEHYSSTSGTTYTSARTSAARGSRWSIRPAVAELSHAQLDVAAAFFGLRESGGFVVVGGAALLALELIDRPTEDLDFVTDDPTRISDAVAALIEGAGRTGGDSIRVGCSPDVSSSGFTGIEVVRLPMLCRLQSLLPPGVYGRGFRSAR